jgi:hypothetical protein
MPRALLPPLQFFPLYQIQKLIVLHIFFNVLIVKIHCTRHHAVIIILDIFYCLIELAFDALCPSGFFPAVKIRPVTVPGFCTVFPHTTEGAIRPAFGRTDIAYTPPPIGVSFCSSCHKGLGGGSCLRSADITGGNCCSGSFGLRSANLAIDYVFRGWLFGVYVGKFEVFEAVRNRPRDLSGTISTGRAGGRPADIGGLTW